MCQSTFSDLAPEPKKKVTRKERFLSEMDAVLPWQLLLEPIRQRYPRTGRGRPPIPVETLLRIYLMQL
jgi:IS5 family transposase